MLDPSLYIHGIPGLDEALPVTVYADLTDSQVETVINNIQSRRLLGVQFKGEWYAEAPAFCEDKLRRIWSSKPDNDREPKNQRTSDQANHSSTGSPEPQVSQDLRFARVLGLNGRVTRDDVKRKWKELSVQYHPDKVAHLGPKLREVAEHEMKMINEAYDFFRNKYEI